MKLRVKTIYSILFILLFIPHILLASGDIKRIETLKKDRNAWASMSKVLNRYSRDLSEIGIKLIDSEDKQLQYAAECVIDISNAVGLLEIVYTLNANCSQTCLTIRDLYKQNLRALSNASNVTDFYKSKIHELYNKTQDTDALRLIGESIESIKELQKTLDDERKNLFSKLRETKK